MNQNTSVSTTDELSNPTKIHSIIIAKWSKYLVSKNFGYNKNYALLVFLLNNNNENFLTYGKSYSNLKQDYYDIFRIPQNRVNSESHYTYSYYHYNYYNLLNITNKEPSSKNMIVCFDNEQTQYSYISKLNYSIYPKILQYTRKDANKNEITELTLFEIKFNHLIQNFQENYSTGTLTDSVTQAFKILLQDYIYRIFQILLRKKDDWRKLTCNWPKNFNPPDYCEFISFKIKAFLRDFCNISFNINLYENGCCKNLSAFAVPDSFVHCIYPEIAIGYGILADFDKGVLIFYNFLQTSKKINTTCAIDILNDPVYTTSKKIILFINMAIIEYFIQTQA
ncbi:uncharacterized protein SCDLUD_002575 [Saccharomycodes ludwigii]|uniref:uncharacterized protein n=1 Tax=Saccharomycodes ludwigii TaxID=36035 RepID=UPI001E869DE9|nr:hypothetical protein SCDLUD_002575 [Saccharomycodes ludwigii]KAH3901099.1 hypothetical protein SCDLUD_002575 [Saccharomycodes ludwigii]